MRKKLHRLWIRLCYFLTDILEFEFQRLRLFLFSKNQQKTSEKKGLKILCRIMFNYIDNVKWDRSIMIHENFNVRCSSSVRLAEMKKRNFNNYTSICIALGCKYLHSYLGEQRNYSSRAFKLLQSGVARALIYPVWFGLSRRWMLSWWTVIWINLYFKITIKTFWRF